MRTRSKFLRIYLPLVVVVAVLVAMSPRTAKWGYDYKIGQPWKYDDLISSFDFPILKTDEQITADRVSAASSTIPSYRRSEKAEVEVFKMLSSLEMEDAADAKAPIVLSLRRIYDRGVLPDEDIEDETILLHRGKQIEKVPVSELYTIAEAKELLFQEVSEDCPDINVDSLFQAANISSLVVPNISYDEYSTAIAQNRSAEVVSNTLGYVKSNTIIVKNGELVTADLQQKLDSYKAEYESNYGSSTSGWLVWIGDIIIALAIVVALFLGIFFSNKAVLTDTRRYLYLLTVFLLITVCSLAIINYNEQYLFLFPFSIGALYLQEFFKTRVIYPFYIVSLLPILIFSPNGVIVFTMAVVSGSVTLGVFKYFSKGASQFLAALISFSVLAVIYFGFVLMGMANYSHLKILVMLFVGSMLQVAAYPLVYLFEKLFNLVSNSRLQEMADTSNPLVRRLEQNAPGTFQHSLQVMNIATSAARALGADEFLLRAGALYHDIGKINNPQCFVENESLMSAGIKYHDTITPIQSAQDIIRHVDDGLEIARENHLPQVVMDFIETHHGTGFASFFYDKHIKQGGDPSQRSEFCYHGRKPQTVEQVILMFSDSLEAASRTLKDYSPETISELVDRIIDAKMDEHQMDEAEISIKQLGELRSILKQYLSQMYHERVKYPNKKK